LVLAEHYTFGHLPVEKSPEPEAIVRGLLFLSLLACGAATGCGAAEQPADDVVWDTTGAVVVTIREKAASREMSASPAMAAPSADDGLPEAGHPPGETHWLTGATPFIEIGSADGPEALFQATHLVPLPDGSLAIANRGAQEIRFYDGEGRWLRSAGGSGSGPGEFVELSSLHALGPDSLLAFDAGNRRVSVFDARGAFVRSLELRPPPTGDYPELVGVLDDGSFIVLLTSGVPTGYPFGRGIVYQLTGHLYRLGSDGHTLLADLGAYPRELNYAYGVRSDRRIYGFQVPLTAVLRVASAGAAIHIGAGRRYEIATLGLDGSLRRLLRREGRPVQLTAALVEEARRAMLDRAAREGERTTIEHLFLDNPFPEHAPAHGALLVDARGWLWVQEPPLPGTDSVSWAAYDDGGGRRGTLLLPAELDLLHIGDDRVIGRSRDSLGVEKIGIWRMHER
jgi:hypothetical protein